MQLMSVRLNEIVPDPDQPRKHIDELELAALAGSIAATGVIQPINIRRNPNGGGYMIISGERRWRASKIAGKSEIPCVLVAGDGGGEEEEEEETELSADVIFAYQIGENLHRDELNPVEKAEFIMDRINYLKEKGISDPVECVAKELGVSPSWISKNTAVLKYAPEVRALARDGKLRDYSMLKKISTLREDKKKEAIDLIQKGQFNSKDFFARKKAAIPTVVVFKDEEEQAIKTKPFKASMSQRQCILLIDKTEFSSVLQRHSNDWRSAPPEKFKEYFKMFTDWIMED